jgi:hypothetical protein
MDVRKDAVRGLEGDLVSLQGKGEIRRAWIVPAKPVGMKKIPPASVSVMTGDKALPFADGTAAPW